MDALYILFTKNQEILLKKEYKEKDNNLKLQLFLMEINEIVYNQKSPYLLLDNTFFIFLEEPNAGIIYLSLVSEDNLILSVYKILENINKSLLQAFDNNLSVDLIRDNIIDIILMVDQYLFAGVPVLNEVNVLSSLIIPYKLTDKITEKFVGKAKDYETRTLSNYAAQTQTDYDGYKYLDENIRSNYEILFHFHDYLELICDRNFNQIHKICNSEIEVISQIPSNVDFNLLLNLPFSVLDFSVDECVTSKKKEILKNKNIDFTTKHGKFILAQFIPNITNQLILPFKIGVSSNSTNNILNINISIELVAIRDMFYPLEDIEIKILVPENYNNSNLSVNIGEFEFKQKSENKNVSEKAAIWTIPKLDKNFSATLKGNLATDKNILSHCSSSCVLAFSCKIDKFSLTGGQVTKGTITKNQKNYEIGKKGKNITYIRKLEIII